MGIVRDPASRDRHKAFVEIREIVEGREAFSLVLKLAGCGKSNFRGEAALFVRIFGSEYLKP